MTEWESFFVAQAGASAALAGLIFVSISISLDELLKYPNLVFRAAVALGLLLSVLVVSTLLLAPRTSERAVGLELLGVGIVAWLVITAMSALGLRRTAAPFRRYSWLSLAMVQVAMIPFVIAGIVTLISGTDGRYWLLPGFIACFLIAVFDAWVLLVEMRR